MIKDQTPQQMPGVLGSGHAQGNFAKGDLNLMAQSYLIFISINILRERTTPISQKVPEARHTSVYSSSIFKQYAVLARFDIRSLQNLSPETVGPVIGFTSPILHRYFKKNYELKIHNT